MAEQTSNQTQTPTSDAYDTHIIPAETAARKDREGDHYKQLPELEKDADSMDTAGGYTVDKEGLLNNYATEPEMYVETPGDLQATSGSTATPTQYSIIDIFPSHFEAGGTALKMKAEGLSADKISILGKGYQDTEHVHGALNWKAITQSGGLVAALTELGISQIDALRYETAIDEGKFLVLVMGSDADITQAYDILQTIGHRISAATAP